MSKMVDITGQTFNELRAIRYIGNRLWECECSCGKIINVSSYALRKGSIKSCGHGIFKDITGENFGEWEVLEYAGSDHGNSLWKCRCSCGNERIVHGNRLKSGRSRSCGHATNKFKDLTAKEFGNWEVIEYVGNRAWKCKCICGNIKEIDTSSLLRGYSTSCGCNMSEKRRETMISKYGDVVANKNRERWQLDVVKSRENMLQYILNKENKPTALELSDELEINTNNVYRKIHKFNLEDYVIINRNSSKYEEEICSILSKLGVEYSRLNRSEVSGYELDIYIPSRRIAIEFNGSYWHSELYKDRMYHQTKSITALRDGISVLHIFEPEWSGKTKVKIVEYIKDILTEHSEIIVDLDIRTISDEEIINFLDEYHIQEAVTGEICIGAFHNNELVTVMAFDKNDTTERQYELISACWKSSRYALIGGSKILNYFISAFNPKSIISYVDISKLSGSTYEDLGFKCVGVTDPDYYWYNIYNKNIITECENQILNIIGVEGTNTHDSCEDIMDRHGYVRVYTCGKRKFIWGEQNGS